MRNLEKDEIEMAGRREKMLSVGFRLFSEKTIEDVSMQEVAKACGLGVATLYRYFRTKQALVIAIAVKLWKQYYIEVEKMYRARGGSTMNAAEELAFFLDCFLDLYKNHKDVLRFNRNLHIYVRHEGVSPEDMRPYNEVVGVFAMKFHAVYQKAKIDGTLRVDLPELKFFASSLHIMLAVSEKYAEGLLYPPNEALDADLSDELELLKSMILQHYLA